MSNRRIELLLVLGIGIVGAIVLNQLAGRFPFRIDLTEEKRFTISEATEELLDQLDDIVVVEVYLEGQMPSGFKRLQRAIRETLDEFTIHAGANIQYSFVDPTAAKSEQARNEFFQSLAQKGIQPTNVSFNEDGKKSEKLLFPGALVSYGGQEKGVMLLKGSRASNPEEQLNQSIEGMEFELANGIRTLVESERRTIGLVKGHGELDSLELADFTNTLLEKYDVFNVQVDRPIRGYDVLMFIKPRTAFSESEKYNVDQYIMNGGKAVFFIDALQVNLDSASGEGTLALPYQHNLLDQLFRYGVRINNNLVMDLSSGQYPVVAGNVGNQPQIRLIPWPFFPVINQYGDHPIVKNLDAVYTKFVSNIDTVKADGIVKTPLMYSSQYSRVLEPPVRVSFNDMRSSLNPDVFNYGPQAIGYLLEGNFTSLYRNRILPPGKDRSTFKEIGEPSKIVVIADGDIARNEINVRTGQPVELGYDQFTRVNYANKDFINNTLEYLLDEKGIINARKKEVVIRPLDKVKVQEGKLKWQVINLLLPLLALLVYGVIRHYLRVRKYAKFKVQ